MFHKSEERIISYPTSFLRGFVEFIYFRKMRNPISVIPAENALRA